MKLFRGLDKTDYQDVLRAIGLYLDDQKLCNVRIIEHDEGLIVQATRRAEGQTVEAYESVLLTDDDLQQLLRYSYNRRLGGSGMPPSPRPTGRPLMSRRGGAGAAR